MATTRRLLTAEQKVQLEALVDGASLSGVFEALSDIAAGKAEHIATAWQEGDGAAYRAWVKAGVMVEQLGERIHDRFGL